MVHIIGNLRGVFGAQATPPKVSFWGGTPETPHTSLLEVPPVLAPTTILIMDRC
jgi:hypothetical protein